MWKYEVVNLVKCLDLDAELLNKQNAYNDLSKSYSQLEKHCISIELTMQFNQEIFQKDSLSNNQNALEILEYFENNDLKAQLQAKDTTIYKLKEHIKSMRENNKEEKVKHEMEEIETINIDWSIESLVYVQDTCPNAIKLSEKKVSITPMNKVEKVRFSEPLTSSSNTKHAESSKTFDSNTPMLSSTGLKCDDIK
ncbi:hypothetical protein Tco_0844716 [Tanacetum coccineum]